MAKDAEGTLAVPEGLSDLLGGATLDEVGTQGFVLALPSGLRFQEIPAAFS
jgi:hypothetical protein